MSPRAACRLEALGFRTVYDYVLGISDWKAAGLPIDGEERSTGRIDEASRSDVPTASPEERLSAVRERVDVTDGLWEEAVVVDCGGVVVGRLRGSRWDHKSETIVGNVMELGPTTVRPDGALDSLLDRMEKHGTELVVVSDAQGRLIGVVLLDDARRIAAGEPRDAVLQDCDGCGGRWTATT